MFLHNFLVMVGVFENVFEAKLAIRRGLIKVNGIVITDTQHRMLPGSYNIQVDGEKKTFGQKIVDGIMNYVNDMF